MPTSDPNARALPVRTEVRPGVWLDGRQALWLAAERLLVIADLHWGYVDCHRARGNLLPAWGDEDIAGRLRGLLADYAPDEMLWLGDIVHAAEGGRRAEAFLRTCATRTTLLAGNHDRRWAAAVERACRRGAYFFHHGDGAPAIPAGCLEVVGHHHPAVSWDDGAGGRVKLPALVDAGHRLILPAFSPWAAGTPWRSAGGGETLWAVAPRRIFRVKAPRPAAMAGTTP